MKLNKAGICLFILSSVASLLCLEAGLRMTGLALNKSRQSIFIPENQIPTNSYYDVDTFYENYKDSERKETKNIWAIGDSFTNGGNVESHESYPAFLFKLLQDDNFNYSVKNLGKCEDPTWAVYERLKNNLENDTNKNNKPEIVIVLTGASDAFYYQFSGMDSLIKSNAKEKTMNFSIKKKSWFKQLRIYKVYRHIILNLINQNISDGGGNLSLKTMDKLLTIYQTIIKSPPKTKKKWIEYEKLVISILGNKSEFVDGGTPYQFSMEDRDKYVFNTLVIPRMRGFASRMEYNKGLEVIFDFMIDYPKYFWSDERNDPYALHVISQLMMFQSKYTSIDMNVLLSRSIKNVDLYKKSKLYRMAEKMFGEKNKIEKIVLQKRLMIWTEIKKLSVKHNFEILLLTYASDFTKANDMTKRMAQKYNFQVVDNNKIFKSLTAKYGRENLFADDNHFQPKGYELMAINVFEKLKESRMIK
jgi:lysophospholipase L1-like esterase